MSEVPNHYDPHPADDQQPVVLDTDVDEVVEYPDDKDMTDYDQYRSLSTAAVVSVILGVLSLAAIVSPLLLLIPIVGIGVGLYAFGKIRRRSNELTGAGTAIAGVVLSTAMLVGFWGMHHVLGVMEVPEGYIPISYWELQPDENYPDMPIPPSALELDGKKVFVKGYVYPHNRRTDLKEFILVPDMKQCCFGGQPALTDMIQVTLQDPLRVDFAYRRRGVGGTLKVHRDLQRRSELTGVYYELDADHIQ